MRVAHCFLSGAQFKAIVEYAPSQQVPKSNIKKDGREGTIMKGSWQSYYLTLPSVLSGTIPLCLFIIILSLVYFMELLDLEYLELLERITKPSEHLPSAEIQLERKEAERAGKLCHQHYPIKSTIFSQLTWPF
jgi:regulator of nonsense transcripts 3